MERLAAASVEGLYTDPFWFARYGEERTRRFGGEDAVFHVRYLVQALDAGEVGILERYARWLQGLLVPRGMCSLHIAANFEGLHAALVQEGLTQPPLALEYVRAARAALQWPEGSARAVQDALPALVAHGVRTLAPGVRLEGELRLQLSYLMDALGAQRPALFINHVRWYAGFWPQRGFDCGYRELLECLEVALMKHASGWKVPQVTVAMGLTELQKVLS